jgi:hypothetical protein
MQRVFTYLKSRRERLLAAYLAHNGKVITVIVQASQTQDDTTHASPPEQRYIHLITAAWTDPHSGRAYVFQQEFRSWRAIHCRVGDMVQVLLDPHNYHHYLMQTV